MTEQQEQEEERMKLSQEKDSHLELDRLRRQVRAGMAKKAAEKRKTA